MKLTDLEIDLLKYTAQAQESRIQLTDKGLSVVMGLPESVITNAFDSLIAKRLLS